jgi:hypothetical protein
VAIYRVSLPHAQCSESVALSSVELKRLDKIYLSFTASRRRVGRDDGILEVVPCDTHVALAKYLLQGLSKHSSMKNYLQSTGGCYSNRHLLHVVSKSSLSLFRALRPSLRHLRLRRSSHRRFATRISLKHSFLQKRPAAARIALRWPSMGGITQVKGM